MAEPYFSIIIPTYNRGHLIQTTIESVLSQDFPNFELIIVDDGSTDNTLGKVKEFQDPRIRYLFKDNRERGAARNTGMEIAIGEYITFLDSDDILYTNHLTHAYKKLKEFKDPYFYRQAYEIKNSEGKVLFTNNKVKADANFFILNGNYFSCIGVFLKKEVTKIVQFSTDRDLSPSEDWEYWLRLSVRYKFYYDNTVTCCMLHHEERSLCSFNEKKNRLTISLFIKSLRNDVIFMQQRAQYLNKIRAQMYSLMCLNKVLHNQKKGLLKDVIKTIKLSPKEIFRRRTLAIIKYYLIKP